MPTRRLDSFAQVVLFALLLTAQTASAQHEPRGGVEKEPHQSQTPAEVREQAQDEANRRAAEAALQAELAEDERVIAAGGLVKVVRSLEYWSGEGKDFSQWYSLRSAGTPAGYVLASDVFHLVGDRLCGSWAECSRAVVTPDGVTWQFRMQGHDENKRLVFNSFKITFNKYGDDSGSIGSDIDFRIEGRKATSVGILKTRYLPAPRKPETTQPLPDRLPMNLAAYCQRRGYTGVSNLDGTGYGWRCMPGNISIDAFSVCKEQYGVEYRPGLASPPPGKPGDWYCARP